MTQPAITRDGNRITLSGDLTVKTARRLFDKMPAFGETPAFGAQEVTVDLKSVREADSAGLALLVHWSNLARSSSAELVFTGAPAQLRQMAKITGLEELFGAPATVQP